MKKSRTSGNWSKASVSGDIVQGLREGTQPDSISLTHWLPSVRSRLGDGELHVGGGIVFLTAEGRVTLIIMDTLI